MRTRKINNLVLVVEDDPDIGELIKLVLEQNGCVVKICNDGRQVEGVIKQTAPFLIFMDLWIPGINGVDLTKKLKANNKYKHIPIIITSAQNSLEKVAHKTEADGYLPKPFNISSLTGLVNKYSKY